jgi:hypothetical protein
MVGSIRVRNMKNPFFGYPGDGRAYDSFDFLLNFEKTKFMVWLKLGQ